MCHWGKMAQKFGFAGLWAESPVDAEHLVVDQRGHGHEVKDAAAVAPRVHVAILGLALV